MLRECTLFAPVFGCSWSLSSFYSLERFCLSSFRSPRSLASLTSNIVVALLICTGPFLPHGFSIPTWDFEPLPRCPSCWYSALLQHSSLCRFIQLAVLSIPLSVDKSGASSFSFLWWATMFGNRIIEPGIFRIPERLFFSSFLYLLASINPRLLNLFEAISIPPLPELSQKDNSHPS